MRLEQFRPAKSRIIIGGEYHYLAPFSLGKMVDLAQFYGIPDKVDLAVGIIQSDSVSGLDNILRLLYFFLEDQDNFPAFCKFKKTMMDELSSGKSIAEYHAVLMENIANAQPIYDRDDLERIDTESRRLDKKSPNPDWSELYKRYASVIPCTIDQFYGLTMRQVFAAFKSGPSKPGQPSKVKSKFSKSEDDFFTKQAKRDLYTWRPKAKTNS